MIKIIRLRKNKNLFLFESFVLESNMDFLMTTNIGYCLFKILLLINFDSSVHIILPNVQEFSS